jgi:hypothetical protein
MKDKRTFDIFTENEVPDIDKDTIKQFSKGIKARNAQDNTYPWQELDADQPPIHGINLRLNDYELALIRFLAKSEDRSQQKIIKKLLIPALEEGAKKLLDS